VSTLAEFKEADAHAPSRFISITKARCIARYRMHSVPGRPEELESNWIMRSDGSARVISFGYTHGTLRIRKHGGRGNREWIETLDVALKDGWLNEIYAFLDDWMGFKPLPSPPELASGSVNRRPIREETPSDVANRMGQTIRRAIRDNPQA
jgi:hypothetical protein